MPTIDHFEPGTPSWVDLASPELASSVTFYTSLFGWEAHGQGPEGGGYTMFELDGLPVAGATPMFMEGQPPAWTTYVSVDDADETIAKVEKAGGFVFVEPMDVLDVGRTAVFADPTGAAIAVWQPKLHKGAGVVNEPNSLCWNELSTRDTKAAGAFYREVFGWVPDTAPMGDTEYTQWMLDGNSIGGMMTMSAEVPAEVPAYWLVYFAVADCDSTVDAATTLGATVTVPAMEIEPGRMPILSDPQRTLFGVIAINTA